VIRALVLAVALAAPSAAPAACLDYNPRTVVLEGRLEARVGTASIPGVPNQQESVPWYALVLDQPVCLNGVARGLLRAERGVRTLQVTLGEPSVLDRALLGERVRVTGLLHHRRASRQYTPVLIHAQAVRPGSI